MLKTFTRIILLCCLISLTFGQSLELVPYGVSPRVAGADTSDMFDVAYNALPNVGIETKMYLMAEFVDSTITGLTWTVTSAPNGSAAAFGTPLAVGDNVEIAAFTPDLFGTYVLTVSEGSTSGDLTITVGTFLGVSNGTPSCQSCHAGKYDEWMATGHSDMLVRAFEGTLSSHYGSYCIKCHSVGYDPNADNDGFDDHGFVYPDSTTLVDVYGSPDGHFFEGLYDLLAADYPDAFERANIQCEACHGPGSLHNGAADIMSSTLDVANCAICHDDGHYHVYPEEWANGPHMTVPPYPGGTNTYCGGCHNGLQFIQFADGEEITVQPPAAITCAVCHDPHSVENEHQVRLVTATLANGDDVMDAGTGGLCMNCHRSRREANSYSDAPHSHYGPHYVPQADMLLGVNAVTFGRRLPSSPHFQDTENACVDCHMASNLDHEAGSHSFLMSTEAGVDNVGACADCHGDIGVSFGDKMFYVNGMADHDGDGVDEGLQDEVHGLMDELAALLPAADGNTAYDAHDDVDTTFTLTELKAAYNYEMVYYDHSYGIHNPAFTVALLKVSIAALMNNAIEGDIVAIEDVPNDQGYQVRIVWDRFVDDGIAVDPIDFYSVKRFDDFGDQPGWTVVGEVSATASNRYALTVPTVFNNVGTDTAWTEFVVEAVSMAGMVYPSLPGAGFSIDNLVPQAPTAVVASAGENYSVGLTWDASIAPDVNYYKIYRDGAEIATTTELTYNDAGLDLGTYSYTITAVDFSGNEGDASSEVSADVLGVDDGTQPIEYSLSQNFPNPFNPTTTINFSIREAGLVKLTVVNSVGQEVADLVNRDLEAGRHSVTFRADNLPTGVYFYHITSDNFNATRKMVLLK